MALCPQHRPSALLLCLALGCGAAPGPDAPSAAEPVANSAPIIERLAFEPVPPLPGETLQVRADVSDPEGDPIALAYSWTVDGKPMQSGTGTLRLPESRKGQRIAVRVRASDGRLDSKPATLAVEVGDQPAQIEALEIQPGHSVTAGESISVRARTADPDGDVPELTYHWSVNGEIDASATGPELHTANLQRGDTIVIEVRIGDAGHSVASPPIHIANAPPRVVSRPVPPGADGFYYQVEAIDPDGDAPLRFSLEIRPEA